VGETRETYERTTFEHTLGWKPEIKKPAARTRRGWEDTIKMDPEEIGWGH